MLVAMPHLVDGRYLLALLAHIAGHHGVSPADLRELLGLSRATVARLISNARRQYGVAIVWRRDRTLPGGGEYSISDWGVFDQMRVRAKVIEWPKKGTQPKQRH
jgi:biotin operon repressor